MRKFLSKGDYGAFISLIHLSYILVRSLNRKQKASFLTLVGFYIASIFIQGFSIGLFYFGVQHYIDESSSGLLSRILKYFSLELNSVEQLVISLFPAILLLLLSSKVLSVSRIGLSRLVLRLRESLVNKYISSSNIVCSEEDDTFYKSMDGTFGSMRALFLNAFVFAQALVAMCALIYLEPWLGLFNGVFLLFFMWLLTKVNQKKVSQVENYNSSAADEAAEASAEIEGVGISSKSFERLERMRVYGRNASNTVLFLSVILGIVASLDFLTSLDKLTLIIFLLRYISNIYTPIAVISASCVPFKSNIITLINIENYMDVLKEESFLTNGEPRRGLIFIAKSFKDRQFFTDVQYIKEAEEKYKLVLGVQTLRVETANFSKDYPREKKKIKNFVREYMEPNDNIYFLV